MNFCFRADASTYIGTGHIIRCLALADELNRRGDRIYFVCRKEKEDLIELIEKRGYKVFSLPKGINIGIDKEMTGTFLQRIPGVIDWLIVDHYDIGISWESFQRDYVRNIMVIDDLANRKHDADVLLDQQHNTNKLRYDNIVPSDCIKLLGTEFAIIRPQFCKVRESLRDREGDIKRIFIFMGGSDSKNLTCLALNAIKRINFPEISIDIVIGSLNQYHKDIERLANKIPNTSIHYNVENMAELMAASDLAVGSGGTTTWERCCVGLPTIMLTSAENQLTIAEELSKGGYVVYVGWHRSIVENDIYEKLLFLLKNKELVKQLSLKVKRLVDGKGTMRVVNKLIYF